jgi:putative hydrolase of the HAD superfamily
MIKIIAFDLNGVLFPTPKHIDTVVFDFIKECKSLGYMIVAASNASKGSFEWRSNEYNLMDYFDGRIISSDIGTRKPSKKFFEYMINILGCNPEEILLIDDQDVNIQSASRLGINSYKYEGIQTLDKIRGILKDQGITR